MLLPDVVLVAVYGAPYSSDTIKIIYNSISYKFLKLRPFRRLHIMCYFLLIISLYTHSQQSVHARSIFHHLKIVGTGKSRMTIIYTWPKKQILICEKLKKVDIVNEKTF